MLFQTLDNKSVCVGVYTNNELHFGVDKIPDGLSRTWSYVPYLKDKDIEYAKLYLEGRSLEEVLPEYLLDDWEDVTKSLSAFNRSHTLAKINMDDNCFYDLVPTRFLVDYCEIKNIITEYVFKQCPRPQRYEFYKHVYMMLRDMEEREVRYDKKMIASYAEGKLSGHAKNLLACRPKVCYNQFGTVTGRLTTKKNSFPILTMPRSFRKSITPHNDLFVELDFNGAEIRTLLGLLGREQPTKDIHQYHMDEVFERSLDRESAKQAFFAWLYGSKKHTSSLEGKKLDAFYSKKVLLDQYYNNGTIRTPYKKEIKNTSKHHALNYLIQSTTAELVLKQSLKINHYLCSKDSESFLAFIIHDAVILDLKNEDLKYLEAVQHLMASTNFGNFNINIKKGKTLGDLRFG